MKAAVFRRPGVLDMAQVDMPRLQNRDDVLLLTEVASICGTDVNILRTPPRHPARPDTVLGHEYVGRVAECGDDVRSVKPGDRVIVNPNPPCGHCSYCLSGRGNMCVNIETIGIFRDGGFAECSVVPEKAVHRMPEGMDPQVAIFAEPLSCAVNALSKVSLFPGQTACILGAGPMGLCNLILLRAAGISRVYVSECNQERRELARRLGAETIDPTDSDVRDELLRRNHGEGVDITVEAVGTLLNMAVEIAKVNGTIVLMGMDETACPAVSQFRIARAELRILGSFIAGNAFGQTIALLAAGNLPVEQLITHRIPLRDIDSGLELMRRGEATKILVYP